jgi:hypothetical protein
LKACEPFGTYHEFRTSSYKEYTHGNITTQLLNGMAAGTRDNKTIAPRMAAMYGHEVAVQLLLEAAADVNREGHQCRTVLTT